MNVPRAARCARATLLALCLCACGATPDPTRGVAGTPARSTAAPAASSASSVAAAPLQPPRVSRDRAVVRCTPIGATPETVAPAPGAKVFTSDGVDLFWSDGSALFRRAVAGGETTKIVARVSGVADVTGLAIDGDELWFIASRWTDRGCLGLVGRYGRDGGKQTRVGPAGCAKGLALTPDTAVIAIEGSSPGDGSIVGSYFAVPRAPGKKTIVLRRNVNGSGAVATDGQYAYFPDGIGTLGRIALADGPTEPLARRGPAIDSVSGERFAVDESGVYFFFGHLNLNGQRIARLPREGGDMTILGDALPATQQGSGYPRGAIQLGDAHAYWSTPGAGEVLRVTKSGACRVEPIAQGQPGADWLALTKTHLYWLNGSASPPVVMRLAL